MSQTQLAHEFSPLSMLRSPRPFIMIRCIRVLLKLSMPKARIKQIFKRSSHQIYNVSIFFVFFMTFYGLLGVQLFGELKHHCVRKNVSVKGQLISKYPFGIIVWTKIPTKLFLDFCPEFFVASWGLPGSFLGFLGT